MKKLLVLFAAMSLVLSGCSNDPYGYQIKDGRIVYNTPERPADQQSMLGFACDPIPNVRVGFIGLGMRGPAALPRYANIEGATITALCDLLPERVEKAEKVLERYGITASETYSEEDGWMKLCESENIDLVYLAVPWQLHTKMAVYAMEHGKHVAIEVPAATSIAECWALVNTSERTRKHCMMLENCCYDFFELTCLNMAQQGVFGEIVHAEGAYCHNLDSYWTKYQGDWRMLFNRAHHGDVYPTHGIGPVCQALNIHRGDKMDELVAMDTKPFRGQTLGDKYYGEGAVDYQNGDNTSTLVRTHNGKTILVEHSTITPRPYSRMYQLQGTEGLANKYPNEGLAVKEYDPERYCTPEEREALMAKYKHPIISTEGFEEKAKQVGGHGGMDFIMDYRLIYCLNNGLPLDMDVYDAAEWSSLVELTEVSIKNGSMPVVFPDFTRGEWNKTEGLHFAL